jgi:glucose/arabinose dehydrogenase
MTRFILAVAPATLLAALTFVSSLSVAQAEAVKSGDPKLNIESLAKLDNPWGMAFLPDGRLLITEKPGRLRIYENGKLSEPVSGVPEVVYRDQGGLLDVAVDPDFAKNKFVYFSYSEAAAEQPKVESDERDPRVGQEQDLKDTVLKGLAVARGTLDGNALSDVKVIWRQEPKMIGRGHFGGRVLFAADGKLFITSGDRQRFDPAQDLSANLGKVVRINPDGSSPEDNPFAGRKGARADIWSFGHRNMLGAAIHPESKELWINEMGPKGGDELNVIEKGANYGWPIVSDGDHYNNARIPDHKTRPEFKRPIKTWTPVISPSGLIFYGGDLFSGWRGNLVMGGLSSEGLIRLTLDGNKITDEEQIGMDRRIRDLIEAPDGGILVVSDGDEGELLRLTPKAGPGPAASGNKPADRALR